MLYFIVQEFVGGDDGGVGEALVKFGNFDLLLVLLHFLDRIGVHCKLFQLALDFPLQVAGNLACAFGYDGDVFGRPLVLPPLLYGLF